MAFISVVLSVLNDAPFLNQCLDSFLTQTSDDFQLICIDWGSNDASQIILAEYAQHDERITVINRSGSSQDEMYNYVVQYATGDYIYFCDAGDYVERIFIERLKDQVNTYQVDVLFFDAQTFESHTNTVIPRTQMWPQFYSNKTVFSYRDAPQHIMTISSTDIWTKLFSLSFLKEKKLSFSPFDKTTEIVFIALALCEASQFLSLNEKLVHHRTKKGNLRHIKHSPTDVLTAVTQLYTELCNRERYEELEFSFANFAVRTLAQCLHGMSDAQERFVLCSHIAHSELIQTKVLAFKRESYESCGDYDCVCGCESAYEYHSRIQNLKQGSTEPYVLQERTPTLCVPKVTVIVPAFNVSLWIGQCLDSILRQTLQEIEIIIVDDGSTDATLDVALNYAQHDTRITVMSQHKPGHSCASSRNAALSWDHQWGDYLYFLDADDWIEPNALQTLWERAEKDQLDEVIFDGAAFLDDTKIPSKQAEREFAKYSKYYRRYQDYTGVWDGKDLLCVFHAAEEYRVNVALQFFNKSYFDTSHLRFNQSAAHEDNTFTFQALWHAKRVGYIPQAFYRRRVRSDSLMTSAKQFKHAHGYFLAYQEVLAELWRYPSDVAEQTRTATMIATQLLRNARNDYHKLSFAEKYAFWALNPIDQRNFEVLVRELDTFRTHMEDAEASRERALVAKRAAEAMACTHKHAASSAAADLKKEMQAHRKAESALRDALEKNRRLKKRLDALLSSKSYRIGSALVTPAKKIREAFKPRKNSSK